MYKSIICTIILLWQVSVVAAQTKPANKPATAKPETVSIPISNADLGTFPYFKTFPNFYPRNTGEDSLTLELNRAYFYDGKKFFSVDGKVSSQKQVIYDDKRKRPSEFQVIQEFDKIVSVLGGKKIYTGQLPKELLKPVAGTDDLVALGSTKQVVSGAYAGVVEYVIKTPEKEVWVQLHPYSIASSFYTLLIVEKQEPLLTINTNKKNTVLEDIEKTGKSIISLQFAPDSVELRTASKDELLSIAGVYQAHPEWRLAIFVHNAPVGKPEYTQALTQKRAEGIKQQLMALGVKATAIDASGLGDAKPLTPNDTEQARLLNTRVEIVKL